MAERTVLRMLVVGMKWPPETFLARLLAGLSGRGFELTIAGPTRPRDKRFRELGFRWLSLPSWNRPWPLRLLGAVRVVSAAAVRAAPDLARRLGRAASMTGGGRVDRLVQIAPFAGRRWDLIYFPWNASAIAMLPLFDLGMPVVVSCRGSQLNVAPHNPTRASIREGLKETFRRAALVHCVSQNIHEEARRYGLDPAKAQIIRPAVDTAFFCPADPEVSRSSVPRPFRIITTGNLIWRKGHEFALTAVAQLKARGVPVRFEIVGEGPERQRVSYTVRDLGVGDTVELPGHLGAEQIRDRLRRADAFFLSSVSEGISNSVLEAMACGLPVVTTDCGGMREAVDDRVEGIVVPPRESRAMADALEVLAGDAELRGRMGRAARARAVRDFDARGQLDCWEELCRRAVTGGST